MTLHPSRLFHLLAAAGLASLTGIANAQGSGVIRDGLGNPVRTSSGECITLPGEEVTDERCLPPEVVAQRRAAAEARNTAARAPEPPRLRTDTVKFVGSVPFKLNGAGLSPEARAELLQFLISLEQYYKVQKIEIVGHADSSGPARYNQWLSEKRAESVQILFRAGGVDPRSMTIRGAGENEPLPDVTSPAQHRRVEIQVEVVVKG